MKWMMILIGMFWCHVIDDYMLQGCLASLKQRDWWKDKVADLDHSIYRHDYVVALVCHSISWSCSIMLIPWLIADSTGMQVYLMFLLNVACHALVDHLKANVRCINLIMDQTIHAVQIVLTWLFFLLNR